MTKLFDLAEIVNDATAILLAGGVAIAGFLAAQKFLGFLEYPGIRPQDVDKVAKEIDSRFKIVTRAIDGNTFRGIYDMGGGLYYYRYTPGQEYYIYPLILERFTTEPALFNNVRMIYP